MAQFGSGRAGRPKNDRVVFHHFTGEEVHDIIETLELFNPCTLNECQQIKYAQVYSYLSTIVERPAHQQELEVLSSSPKPSTSGLSTPAPVFARPASASLKRHRDDAPTSPAPATVSSKLPFDSRPMIHALNESMKKTHIAPISAGHATAPSQPSQSAPVAPIDPHVPVKAPSQPSQSAPVAPIEPHASVTAPTHHNSPAGASNTDHWRYNGLPLTRADCNTLINIFGQVINNANVDEDTAEEILEVMLYINKKFKEEDI